jgi:hypothetical protein
MGVQSLEFAGVAVRLITSATATISAARTFRRRSSSATSSRTAAASSVRAASYDAPAS